MVLALFIFFEPNIYLPSFKQFAHWHWENRTTLEHKFKKGDNFYKDRYGLETKRGRLESHLNCLDRDYIDKKGK